MVSFVFFFLNGYADNSNTMNQREKRIMHQIRVQEVIVLLAQGRITTVRRLRLN